MLKKEYVKPLVEVDTNPIQEKILEYHNLQKAIHVIIKLKELILMIGSFFFCLKSPKP